MVIRFAPCIQKLFEGRRNIADWPLVIDANGHALAFGERVKMVAPDAQNRESIGVPSVTARA
jgi:hypothetical protein